MKTLVVGLGNPILGDDGVGWKVAEGVKGPLSGDVHVDVECASLGGISLMERLIGYDRAILIDAFAGDDEEGSILVLNLDQLPNYSAFHTASIHDISLQSAIRLGRSMGAHLPENITVIGVVTKHIYAFCEDLSPPVARAVPCLIKIVLDLLRETAILR